MMCLRSPVYPVIIGNVKGARKMLHDPDWRPDRESRGKGGTSRTGRGGDGPDGSTSVPKWLFREKPDNRKKKINQSIQTKEVPRKPRENQQRRLSQLSQRSNKEEVEMCTPALGGRTTTAPQVRTTRLFRGSQVENHDPGSKTMAQSTDKCVAGPVTTRAQKKREGQVKPLKAKDVASSLEVDKKKLSELQTSHNTLVKCWRKVDKTDIRDQYIAQFQVKRGVLYWKHEHARTGRVSNQVVSSHTSSLNDVAVPYLAV
jgi:hypothetical protein